MTKNNSQKHRIRERMGITGEKYTTARKFLMNRSTIGRRGSSVYHGILTTLDLEDLILNPVDQQKIFEALEKPGLILISGGCGAGKTTLQRTLIKRQLENGIKVTNIEPLSSGRDNAEIEFQGTDNFTFKPVGYDAEIVSAMNSLVFKKDTISLREVRNREQVQSVFSHSATKTVITTIHSTNVFYALDRVRSLSEENELGEALDLVNLIIQVDRRIPEDNDTTPLELNRRSIYNVYTVNEEFKEDYLSS